MNTTLRRWLLAGALCAGAWCAAELADDTAAHAADRKPAKVVERAGGVLDHQLPAQASDRARQAVNKVQPKPKPPECKPPADKPKPTKVKPKPAPVEQPAEPKPRKDPASKLPPVKVPPVVVDPEPTTEPDPAVTLPADDPAPLPDADDNPAPIPGQPPTAQPAPTPTTPVVEPAPLPAAIGPVPAAQPTPATKVTALNVATCGHEPHTINLNRDTIQQLIDSLTRGAATTPQAGSDCPGPAGEATQPGAVKPPPPTGADQIAATLDGTTTAPALARLEHTRARSAIPTGHATRLDPRPA